MPPMMSYEFGDVVLAPFPFSDQSAHKQRPVAVVSSAAYHRDRSDLIVLAITSQIRLTLGVGEALITHWRQAGLIKPGLLKPVLATIDKGLVIRKLGRLPSADREKLREVLSSILGG